MNLRKYLKIKTFKSKTKVSKLFTPLQGIQYLKKGTL